MDIDMDIVAPEEGNERIEGWQDEQAMEWPEWGREWPDQEAMGHADGNPEDDDDELILILVIDIIIIILHQYRLSLRKPPPICTPVRTSQMLGVAWAAEIIFGHPRRAKENLRMTQPVFT
ncbi:hypothetical protein HDU96_005540, partial [Phlyctochytrium bullatum]